MIDESSINSMLQQKASNANEDSHKSLIMSWLQSICKDSLNLLRDLISRGKHNNTDISEDEMEVDVATKTTDELLRDICTTLLACCHPSIVPTAHGCIVKYEEIKNKAEISLDNYNFIPEGTPLGKDSSESKAWIEFRSILRRLAPISSYVAVQVVCNILSGLKGDEEPSLVLAVQQGILLFGHWLPDIAPHLHSIVEEFFLSIPQYVWDAIGKKVTNSSTIAILDETIALAEAMLDICDYYAHGRGDGIRLKSWCDWNWMFDILYYQQKVMKKHDYCETSVDTIMHNADEECATIDDDNTFFGFQNCPCWHSARVAAILMELQPPQRLEFFKRLDEETSSSSQSFYYISKLAIPFWFKKMKKDSCDALKDLFYSGNKPLDPAQIVMALPPLRPCLVHLGLGILHYIHGSLSAVLQTTSTADQMISQRNKTSELVPTQTTEHNLQKIGIALCIDPPPPILVCGVRGSGKSALVRELAHRCCGQTSSSQKLLELHLDEETDSKTLLGTMVATDIPGQFEWKPGPLTLAVQHGRWVLMEDVNNAPAEILAALKPLLEERVLPYNATRERLKAHPNFRLFGTCSVANTAKNADSDNRYENRIQGPNRLLLSGLWRKVYVDSLPYQELGDIVTSRFPFLPKCITDACLTTFRVFHMISSYSEGQHRCTSSINNKTSSAIEEASCISTSDTLRCAEIIKNFMLEASNASALRVSLKTVSIRDFMKLCQRIASSDIFFEPDATFVTEAQRTLCLAETADVFVSSAACRQARLLCIAKICAPIWDVSSSLAVQYVEMRKPELQINESRIVLGRATIPKAVVVALADDCDQSNMVVSSSSCFSDTNYSLRLMESISVCVARNEPMLLVGETGVGKTVVIQRLASMIGKTLVVQNMSLQTDSTDLLGGFRPVEIRQIARQMYESFMELFVLSFSRQQNSEFLNYVTSAFEKSNWKKLSQCFYRASMMRLTKMKELETSENQDTVNPPNTRSWVEFHVAAERFERQRLANLSGLAFAFTEGVLVDAIKTGKWVLLDEVNLASAETLQRLCGLLDDSSASITLSERGDVEALERHPEFRLFAAMNPATDVGKRDLPSSIRARFTEFYVDELVDPIELRSVAARYLKGILIGGSSVLETSDIVIKSVEVYLRCRDLSEQVLIDGGGQRPRYTLRTLTRALSAARCFIVKSGFSPERAVLEGFELAFEGPLDEGSRSLMQKLLHSSLGRGLTKKELDHPGRRPGGKMGAKEYILVRPFWVKAGPFPPVDWTKKNHQGRSNFVLTPSALLHLRRLARVVASSPYAILLEGPTSAGKTTMVEYLAALCGYRCIRINNHEHTDVQEYTGSYVTNSSGSLTFQDGLLVRAMRDGDWIILDELNLAPSEVLEALNRLLDDNRELFLTETNEMIRPHPNFRLFATQNPCGAYGGRKPLSRAFRNRFVEVHMGDIPLEEMAVILEKRCGCPPTHANLLVKVMSALRQRRSKSGVFRGKDGLITPRDLLRWAERGAATKSDLAMEGYMLLVERLREEDERSVVKATIEDIFKVEIDSDSFYYGAHAESRKTYNQLSCQTTGLKIAETKTLLRLFHLVQRCIAQREAVLICGNTGCGKTTVIQLLHILLGRPLLIVNCHATTETTDILGGLRPIRGRDGILFDIVAKGQQLALLYSSSEEPSVEIPTILLASESQNIDHYPSDAASIIYEFSKAIWTALLTQRKESSGESEPTPAASRTVNNKRQKISVDSSTCQNRATKKQMVGASESMESLVFEIAKLFNKYNSLFEWVDGPLVTAMKGGKMFLLDEINLADDAVLERLNSVLEPSRQLTLAEKGGSTDSFLVSKSDGIHVTAHDHFLIFATMNPGNDFGKRELSPALRSRFTEIWVTEEFCREDVDQILLKLLCTEDREQTVSVNSLNRVRVSMLDYMDWFNQELCGGPIPVYSKLKLSVRDIQTWANFVTKVCSTIDHFDIWLAYAHGAALMHLDGLGVGTDLSLEDVAAAKKAAKLFIRKQIPSNVNLDWFVEPVSLHDFDYIKSTSLFGIYPFSIPLGNQEIPSSTSFNLSAPTVSINLQRVLRAMQMPRKPILLEGSPGVGKSATIMALASLSGHRLVRINLSEQTDISDLMGSDLPVQDNVSSNGIEQIESSTIPSFKWSDGVFLSALKRGDWVLLDELNLASQSVLEGLNSCLDHRSQVFIPELGRVFDCPPTFRVFAAINPLSEGGGRKGLPTSFLNRFTKVYVESLTSEDLLVIITNKFPSIPLTISEKIISFNNAVYQNVSILRKFGQTGSPFEFNLRDVFRWCDLIVSEGQEMDLSNAAGFVDTIYMQRFRTKHDRQMLESLCFECFGVQMQPQNCPLISMSNLRFQVKNVFIERNSYTSLAFVDAPVKRRSSSLLRDLFYPMQAVVRCINMNWPCLLVGYAGSGKSTLLRSLAELCNANLEEVALTPASDVTELIGCFEQVDTHSVEKEFFFLLERLRDIFCHRGGNGRDEACSVSRNIRELYWYVHKAHLSTSSTIPLSKNEDLKSAIRQMLHLIETNSRFETEEHRFFLKACTLFDAVVQSKAQTGLFKWVDGILVTAMEKGYWLHLENANLCPSSVLDRLNPLMEENGTLVLTECSSAGGMGNDFGPKIVQPHKNFRIFLSMNPEIGEVSRAMRNRCVEINLIRTTVGSSIDSDISKDLEALCSSNVTATALSNAMVDIHVAQQANFNKFGGEQHTFTDLQEWSVLFIDLVRRGFSIFKAFCKSLESAYDLQDDRAFLLIKEFLGNAESEFIEKDQFNCFETTTEYIQNPCAANIANHARLLDILSSIGSIKKSSIHELPLSLQSISYNPRDGTVLESKYSKVLSNCTNLSIESWQGIEVHAIALFARKMNITDNKTRRLFLDGHNNRASSALRFMSSLLGEILRNSGLLQCIQGVRHLENAFAEFSRPPLDSLECNISMLASMTKQNLICQPSIQSSLLCASKKAALLDVLFASRLDQLLHEQETFQNLNVIELSTMPKRISPIELSFAIHNNVVDELEVRCPVIPLLFPLFRALDALLLQFRTIYFELPPKQCVLNRTCRLLARRDQFWVFLEKAKIDLTSSSELLEIEDSSFFVHLFWLRKSIQHWTRSVITDTEIGTNKMSAALDFLHGVINEVFDALKIVSGGEISFENKFRKRSGYPLVPSSALLWDTKDQLRKLADSCSLPFKEKPISLDVILQANHPFLYVTLEMKHDLLSALCTLQWASTDEMRAAFITEQAKQKLKYLPKLLNGKMDVAGKVFLSKTKNATLDLTIKTVENERTLDEMERLASPSVAADSVTFSAILSKYSQLQVDQFKQIWLLLEEMEIVGEIARCSNKLEEKSEKLRSIAPRLKRFIDEALDCSSFWPISDLRPYQTLVWACEDELSSSSDLTQLLRHIFPLMMYHFNEHQWFNSFNDITFVGVELTTASLRNSKEDDLPCTMHADSARNSLSGPIRLRHPVACSTLLRINGCWLYALTEVPHVTIENVNARLKQKEQLMNILCTMAFEMNPPDEFVIRHQLYDVMKTLSEDFNNTYASQKHISIISSAEFSKELDACILKQCMSPIFREISHVLIEPLFQSIQNFEVHIDNSEDALNSQARVRRRENIGLAWIYLGLLRLKISLPSTPLDPARKPAAKVLQLSDRVSSLVNRLRARQWQSKLIHGEEIPSDPSSLRLLDEAEIVCQKRSRQEKKIAERPQNAKSFRSFYHEVHRFADSIGGVNAVINLAKCLQESYTRPSEENSIAISREVNWQKSAHGFCQRLASVYAPYEDLFVPIVNSIRNIQQGLRELSGISLMMRQTEEEFFVQSVQQELLSFPMVLNPPDISVCFDAASTSVLDNIDQCVKAHMRNSRGFHRSRVALTANTFKVSLIFSFLTRCELSFRANRGHVHPGFLGSLKKAFWALMNVLDPGLQEKDFIGSGETKMTEAEREELIFRQQFPNHAKEFLDIVQSVEAADEYDDVSAEEVKVDSDQTSFELSTDNMQLACSLYQSLFCEKVDDVDDACRIRAFKWNFAAGCQLAPVTEWLEQSTSQMKNVGGHIMGLALSSAISKGKISCKIWNQSQSTTDASFLDFHNDPNPAEVIKAEPVLASFMIRVAQLLTAFPGNAILVSIGQVAERVFQLNFDEVPVGRVLTGFEVILKKAEEWEHQASRRVTIGQPLADMSSMVSKWRKLELDNWSILLDIRERRHAERATAHWAKLFRLINGQAVKTDEVISPVFNNFVYSVSPSWICKGLDAKVKLLLCGSTYFDSYCTKDQSLLEFTKVIDGFILSGGVGEFGKRLNLIKLFADQLFTECENTPMAQRIFARYYRNLALGKVLSSIFKYYIHFSDAITSNIKERRAPIEKKLKDDVKLAKWDEQSYYALAESADKSHRKLNKHLREYDEALETRISVVLESDLTFGIVEEADGQQRPITKVPPITVLFPLVFRIDVGKCDSHVEQPVQCRKLRGRNPKQAGDLVQFFDRYIIDMQRYSMKMSLYLSELDALRYKSFLRCGSSEAEGLSTAIFDRIDSLKTATKPVKQRALIDLFKTLKSNGLSSLKWSVPLQVREMQHLLQLPDPSKLISRLCVDLTEWKKAESYFHRSIAELAMFRHEIAAIRKGDMTPRELALMTGLSEHFLFLLCQQRTILCFVTENLVSVEDCLAQFDKLVFLELGQTTLKSSVEGFNYAFISAVESCCQLSLLLISSCDLISDSNQSSHLRDVISTVKGCIDRLNSAYSPFTVWGRFVSSEILQGIKKTSDIIARTEQEVLLCSQLCVKHKCMPSDVFSGPLDNLRRSFLSAQDCLSLTDKLKDNDADLMENGETLCRAISDVVQASLLSVQTLCKKSNDTCKSIQTNEEADDIDRCNGKATSTLLDYHVNSINEWTSVNTAKLASKLQELKSSLQTSLDSFDLLPQEINVLVDICSDACTLASQVQRTFKARLIDTIGFYKGYSKLTYVLVRIFRNLAAKGFCADNVESNDDANTSVDGMKFEDDVEGTGMGKGVGNNDVTDQIENEEQILGLKGDKPDEAESKGQQQRQLEEEEADTGMEMENDFDGDMFDAPEKKDADEETNDNKDEVELDREMGDESSPNEEIVDEKMWNEDDEQQEQEQDEKFEKDSKIDGQAIEGEMRTKDDTEEESVTDTKKEEASKHECEAGTSDDIDSKDGKVNHDEEAMNEEAEDNYEDPPDGVEVRDERTEQDKLNHDEDMQDDLELQLNDDINLDEMGTNGDVKDLEIDDDDDRKEDDDDNSGLNGEDGSNNEEIENETENQIDAQNVGNCGDTDAKDVPDESDENDVVSLSDPQKDHNDGELEIKQKQFGVQSTNGTDAINQDEDDERSNEVTENNNGSEKNTSQDIQESEEGDHSGSMNDSNGIRGNGKAESSSYEKNQEKPKMDHPNPFRNPGDAEKFWHKKLEILEDTVGCEDEEEAQNRSDNKDDLMEQNLFEFSREREDNSTQVLGATTEEHASKLDLDKMEEHNQNNNEDDLRNSSVNEDVKNTGTEDMLPKRQNKNEKVDRKAAPTGDDNMKERPENTLPIEGEVTDDDYDTNSCPDADLVQTEEDTEEEIVIEESQLKNKVVSDFNQLRLQQDEEGNSFEIQSRYDLLEPYRPPADASTAENVLAGRLRWAELNAETLPISRRLCEKLRLVMEPLVAAKLRGDYRTGKRINMKRIIGYIASGYRKDKIWLRRTKPSKRDYRVLLAVDNSESMAKTGAGSMALLALAALANGMSQLEVGELGVASFGEGMRLLHPFSAPFTTESGTNIACNLNFNETRTRVALCVENAITALEEASGGLSSTLQLVFIISDGRIERDSRSKLRRLMREMSEKNMLCVMIIVEGNDAASMDASSTSKRRKNSIMNMKEATFENGKPKLSHFIDDYPFPYYIVLEDMSSLPEVLDDALRQWFEIVAQMTGA